MNQTDDRALLHFNFSFSIDRLSPTPEKDVQCLVNTDSDFPWTSIEELLSTEDDEAETLSSFRLHGYIGDISKNSSKRQNWKNSLAMLCPFCCIVKNYDAKKVHCEDCDNDRNIVFQFVLILQEYLPNRGDYFDLIFLKKIK